MAEPNDRERALAAEIDAGLIGIELHGMDVARHTKANVDLIARKLAGYRAELAHAPSEAWAERWRGALEKIAELVEPLAGTETRQAVRELDADTPVVVDRLLKELVELRERAHG